MAFTLERYLARIGLADLPAGAAGLAALQEAHMRAIPFENIDPLMGRVPSLALDDVFAKLVTGGRGGYCFEHNALFGAALTALGYAPQSLLARVYTRAGQGGPRSHQAFAVVVEGETWLADTGFGGHGALTPLRLAETVAQAAPNGTYRLRAVGGVTMLERQERAAWVAQYGFDSAPVEPVDLEAANFLCARWPGAPFRDNLLLAVHTPEGRVALFNRGLSRGLPPDAERSTLSGPRALDALLRGSCRLVLEDAQIAAIWARIETAPTGRDDASARAPRRGPRSVAQHHAEEGRSAPAGGDGDGQ